MSKPTDIEQRLELKDGRVIYKTHNGFKSWLLAKGVVTPITDKYYNQVKVHAIGGLKVKRR